MINILKKLIFAPRSFMRICTRSEMETALMANLNATTSAPQIEKKPNVVLIECVEDTYFMGLFGKLMLALRKKQGVVCDQYVMRSVGVGESNSLRVFLGNRLLRNRLFNFKWIRMYAKFCHRVAFVSARCSNPIFFLRDLYRARRDWKSLKSRDDLTHLIIDGVPVGDLINDTYLRFKPASTVNLNDPYLWLLITQTHTDIHQARSYFDRVRPQAYLTSYTTYIQHGVVTRVALQCKVSVFSFGNLQEFCKRLSPQDWMHTKNPVSYASDFSTLPNQQELLSRAEAALVQRLSGGIDSATAYMAQSSYVNTNAIVPDVSGALVVFLHDFYDSPHVYYDMIFPDFWEWICFTIETLRRQDRPFFLKPHPNQIGLSSGVIDQLRERYPDIAILSSEVTNTQLVEGGITCAVTVYGTVAHEMAYLGVPSITCARHPHVAFNFCRNAASKDQYAHLLLESGSFAINKAQMRLESLMFYCAHNLAENDERTELNRSLIEFRKICHSANPDPVAAVEALDKLARLPGFSTYVDELSRFG